MFILIKDINGDYVSRKRSSVCNVSKNVVGSTTVYFTGKGNTPIKVKQSVSAFHNRYLKKE